MNVPSSVDSARIARALERAQEDAAGGPHSAPANGRPRRYRVAIGDPQAPLATFLSVLDRHGLLGEDGRLRPDVHLVSMGDHFDWGSVADRVRAGAEAVRLLAWLAAHPEDQVTLLAGNHDLSRVGELAGHDDASFAAAYGAATRAYRPGDADGEGELEPEADRAFRGRYPEFASAEIAARDLATFRAEQRHWVAHLLRAGRFRLALAASSNLLLVHGGVTRDDLSAIGLAVESHADAGAVARAIGDRLERAIQAWWQAGGREPLAIEPLHRPGSAARGEGRGILYQRPAHPDGHDPDLFTGPPRRRYDPRRLPLGLTQAVGHIRDRKCRELLGPWADGSPPEDGPLRQLQTDGRQVRYAPGVESAPGSGWASVLFLDGGMARAEPARYQLLDLDTRQALRPLGPTGAPRSAPESKLTQ